MYPPVNCKIQGVSCILQPSVKSTDGDLEPKPVDFEKKKIEGGVTRKCLISGSVNRIMSADGLIYAQAADGSDTQPSWELLADAEIEHYLGVMAKGGGIWQKEGDIRPEFGKIRWSMAAKWYLKLESGILSWNLARIWHFELVSGILSCNLSRIWQNKAEYGETWWNLVGMWHFMREYGILIRNVAKWWCFKPECGILNQNVAEMWCFKQEYGQNVAF
ncbi:hypothetical protein B0H10DRAFT_1951766 [Mycena sp. CBHHK59/15]|nr:hypothetical protein B0H10DRAFT_1951766 [Mycena sp. CBHHK59/15]